MNQYDEFNGGDEQDEERRSYQQYEIKEAIVFLIEITPELLMPQADLNSHSQLFEILSSINDLMSELIITMRNTGIGIYFYNCSSSPVLKSMKLPNGFHKLFRLNVLNLQNMKTLNDLIQDHNLQLKPLESSFKYQPMEDENHLSVVLNRIIDEMSAKPQFNRKKLVWITNNDKPYTKTSTKENLWRIINDYYNYNFFIEPFFLSSPTKPFDFEQYKDVFLNTSFLKKSQERQSQENDDDDHERSGGFTKDSPIFKKSMLANQIRKSIFRIKEVRRMLFSCNLILSDNGTIGGGLGCTVKGYTLYSHEKYKKDLLLYTREETIKKVFLDSTMIKSGTGEQIQLKPNKEKSVAQRKEEAGIRKGYEIGGGQDIIFLNSEQLNFITNYAFDHRLEEFEDADEFTEIKEEDDEESEKVLYSEPPYLKLLGFRDLENFSPVYCCGPPVFVTADLNNGMKTTSIKGGFTNSLETLASLYRSCLKLKQYGIVFGCTKRNARPHLYALYPTQTIKSSRNIPDEQDFPQGFLLIKLPWVEDIRSLPEDFITDVDYQTTDLNKAYDDELVQDFKILFQPYTMQYYNPKDFPNPSLNYFYKVIKYEILQMELKPSERTLLKNDITMQKLAQLKQRIDHNDTSQSIIRKINLRLNELEDSLPKRKIPDSVSRSTKRPTTKKLPEIDEEAVLVKWKQGTLNEFTMDQLKGFQKRYPQIKMGSRKAEMVENVTKFLDSREKR
ncbi:KU70 [[Candida] subhashii]|uniref:ATP-dependent DNA helicase II subunit 1 n=1 Tax=[Candida] subhashii TaxID=561895 RepID=A0A8J5QMF9_9ASCO|nr:KU70 [[Candida] subhashii]KAG7661150.1 KU70 [[Candida] subhashii]